MGKKSKRNRRKKNGQKASQDLCSEQKGNSMFDQEVERGKNSKNYGSFGADKKLLNLPLSDYNSIASCKAVTDDLESNPSESDKGNTVKKHESLNTGGTKMKPHMHLTRSCNLNAADTSLSSNGTQSNNLSGEMYCTSVNKSVKVNQGLAFSIRPQVRPAIDFKCELAKSELTEDLPSTNVEKNSSLSGNDEDYPLYFSGEKSIVDVRKKLYNNFFSCAKERNVSSALCAAHWNEESSGSDEECSTSDFFKPVFDDLQSGKSKVTREKKFYGTGDESLCAKNTFSGEEICYDFKRYAEKSDFEGAGDKSSHGAKNTFSDKQTSFGFRTYAETSDVEGKELKETIYNRVDTYKNSKDYFSDVYHTWMPERSNTLQKLRMLLAEVHNDQLNYNKSQETLRELGLMSRSAKTPDNQVFNFLASCTAFLSDAASGMVSVAQAFNVDAYQSKFKEIMEHDAEITQRLYKARSQCVLKYQDIEEVIRKFHSDNFSTTISKISDSLEVGKYWEGMKNAYQKDNMPQLLDIVSKFFDNALQSTKLEEVNDSVQTYANNNPAAAEACKSAGRATYGALNTWGISHSQNSVMKGIDIAANALLIREDAREIQRLRNTIDTLDAPQSKIETQIEDAIDSLESELREINDIYFELFKSLADSDSSDCDYGNVDYDYGGDYGCDY